MGQGSESIGWDDGEDANSIIYAENVVHAHDTAKEARVGSTIMCPACNKPFTKRSYQHCFCSNKGRGNCKDRYWDTVDERKGMRWYK